VVVRRPGREAGHSPLSNAEVKYTELYLHSPTCSDGVGLIERRDNFGKSFIVN
jgi:hypothetical protein